MKHNYYILSSQTTPPLKIKTPTKINADLKFDNIYILLQIEHCDPLLVTGLETVKQSIEHIFIHYCLNAVRVSCSVKELTCVYIFLSKCLIVSYTINQSVKQVLSVIYVSTRSRWYF